MDTDSLMVVVIQRHIQRGWFFVIFTQQHSKDVSESTRQIWSVVFEKKLDLPTVRLQLYDSNGLLLLELPQDENTKATDSTSELLNGGGMETNDESSGSGNILNERNGHIMEANLEDNMELNHNEGSAWEEVQVATVDDSISTVNSPNAEADMLQN